MATFAFVPFATILLLMFILLAGAMTYNYGRRNLLHPVVLVNGILTYYVLVPAAWLIFAGMGAIPSQYDIQHPARSLAVALAVLLAMYAVILVPFRLADHRDTSSGDTSGVTDALADTSPSIVLRLGFAGFAVGVVSYIAYVHLNGGIIRMLTVMPRTAFHRAPNTAVLKHLGMLGVFGGWATILCALRPRLERWRVRQSDFADLIRSIRAAVVCLLVSVIVLAVAVSTRARMVILVPLFIAIVYVHTAGWLSRHTLVGVGSVVIIMGLSFSMLEGLLLGHHVGAILSSLVDNAVHLPRFGLMMVLVESVPSEVPYQLGATLPSAFYLELSGFPRYGNILERIATGNDSKYITFSAMLPGELWLNFGSAGLLVGGAIYGVALRWAYRLRTSSSVLVRGVYPSVFVCILLLWPTNLTWGIPRLLIRFLVPVAVALVGAVAIQRRLPSIARTLDTRVGDG